MNAFKNSLLFAHYGHVVRRRQIVFHHHENFATAPRQLAQRLTKRLRQVGGNRLFLSPLRLLRLEIDPEHAHAHPQQEADEEKEDDKRGAVDEENPRLQRHHELGLQRGRKLHHTIRAEGLFSWDKIIREIF